MLMYIIRVMPLERGVFASSLEYFTQDKLPLGSLIEVPLRKKKILALVTGREPVRDEKTIIKNYPYSIRKISGLKSYKFFEEEVVRVAEELAEYFAGSVGEILAHLAPKAILLEAGNEKTLLKKTKEKISPAKWEGPLLVQAPDEERLAYYKSLIREKFARKSSIFLCMPTITDIEKVADSFEKGIREYTVVLHGNLKKSELLTRWKTATTHKHPLLIIATASFLSLPRRDIRTIILDRESSNQYKLQTRPYIDVRNAVSALAREKKSELILGDVLFRTETIFEKESGRCHPQSSVKYRILNETKNIIADMTRDKETPFAVLSEELAGTIEELGGEKAHMFVFVHRHGLATSTVCGDCGKILLCPRCSAPMVLHEGAPEEKEHTHSISGKNIFVCNKCSMVRDSKTVCDTCGSWKLVPLGIGTKKVEEAIRTRFPGQKMFFFDTTRAKTYGEGRKMIEEFLQAPSAIFIGTESALLFFREKIEYSAVASFDSLLALPDFRIRERALNILLRCKYLAKNTFLVQTKTPELELYQNAVRGNILDFYRDEILVRKKYGYPPFGVLIKITREGSDAIIKKDMQVLEERLIEYSPFVYPAFISRIKGRDRLHLLIKIKSELWPDGKLLKTLRTLPREFSVDINPKDIL